MKKSALLLGVAGLLALLLIGAAQAGQVREQRGKPQEQQGAGTPRQMSTERPAAPRWDPGEQQQVAETMSQLGFTVQEVKRAADGSWEVVVGDFDGRRAGEAFRGAVVAPAQNIGGARGPMAEREGVAGRGGPLGPRGGGTRSEQDGSATGGGSDDGAEGAGPGGRDVGPLPDSGDDGGSASGRFSTLRVSMAADGTMVVDSASLQRAGFTNAVNATGNGRVTFR